MAYQLWLGRKNGDQDTAWCPSHLQKYVMFLWSGGTCFWMHQEERNVDNNASKYTIHSQTSSTQRRTSSTELPRQVFNDAEDDDNGNQCHWSLMMIIMSAVACHLNHTFLSICWPDTSYTRYILTQEEINDLVRDLELSEAKAETLGSRVQQWNLEANIKVTLFRTSDSSWDVWALFPERKWPCVLRCCKWLEECHWN